MRLARFLPAFLFLFLPGAPSLTPFSALPVVIGEVRDTNGPLEGATVRFKGHPFAVRTDVHGRFSLPRHDPSLSRIVASREGYLIAGIAADASPLVLTLTPLPKEDCERYTWVDPFPDPKGRHNCGNCHQEIFKEWSASGHARSVLNPRFLNLYDGSDAKGRPGVGWNLRADHPDGAAVCASCHAPTVNFGDAASDDLRVVSGVAARGVHCDYCHKVSGVTKGQLGLTHGRFGLELLRPSGEQLFFGPLDDVDRGEDSALKLYRESRYCASCHEGTVFGVHVYSTFSEWLDSPARRQGKQCQTCHMAPTGKMTNMAPGRGGIRRDAETLANHRFFAGSQADMLRQAVKVAVTLRREADRVRAELEVRAEDVGHRVPTGFVDRHLILVVEGQRADGQGVIRGEGPMLPAVVGKEFAGKSGRLYAKVLKDFEGNSPAPFWRADPALTDTRLVPGKPDRAAFTFGSDVARVRVRLLYRRFWQEVADVKGWPDGTLVISEQILPVLAHD